MCACSVVQVAPINSETGVETMKTCRPAALAAATFSLRTPSVPASVTSVSESSEHVTFCR